MKYSGLIIWMEANEINIYQYDRDLEFRPKVYNSKVVAMVENNAISVFFNIADTGYSVHFKHTTSNIFEALIEQKSKVQGTAILHLFSFEKKLLCKIHWNEGKAYECIMELSPVE